MRLSIIIFLLFGNLSAIAAQLQIVASNGPIASIIAVIAKDRAQITSVCNSNNVCPHHYSIKPNQLKDFKNADLIVYIDDSFEVFIPKLLIKNLTKNKVIVLKLSQNPELITKICEKTNWHVWLSIENIKTIMNATLSALIKLDSESVDFYNTNYQSALAMINKLEVSMKKLQSLSTPLILDSSLEHFFINFKPENEIERFYSFSQKIKPDDILKLKKSIESTSSKCIFVSSKKNAQRLVDYLADSVKVITLDSESWQVQKPTTRKIKQKSIETLLQEKINGMIDLLAANCL